MEPRALYAHSRPPPYVPPFYGGAELVPVSIDRRTVSTLCAPLGGLRPGAAKPAALLRRLWAPGAGVQACGTAPLTAHTPKCIAIPGALVAASSISFASADGESSSTPLRLLSPQKPLRWVFAGAPFPRARRPGGCRCRSIRMQEAGGRRGNRRNRESRTPEREERSATERGVSRGFSPWTRSLGTFSGARESTPPVGAGPDKP